MLIVIYKNSEGTINRTVTMHHINMFSISGTNKLPIGIFIPEMKILTILGEI